MDVIFGNYYRLRVPQIIVRNHSYGYSTQVLGIIITAINFIIQTHWDQIFLFTIYSYRGQLSFSQRNITLPREAQRLYSTELLSDYSIDHKYQSNEIQEDGEWQHQEEDGANLLAREL